MSLFVYAPNKHLRIDYYSQNIHLQKDGSVVFIYDLLITNKSQDEVNSISILYPKKLYKIKSDDDPILVYTAYDFTDISYTLMSLNSLDDSLQELIMVNNSWLNYSLDDHTYCLTMLRDDDPTQVTEYKGIVGKTQCQPSKWSNVASKHVMDKVSSAELITCKCKQPIAENNSRWFRWKIKDNITGVSNNSILLKLIYKLQSELYYDYEIIDPYQTFSNFKKELLSYAGVLRQMIESPPHHGIVNEVISSKESSKQYEENLKQYYELYQNTIKLIFEDEGFNDNGNTKTEIGRYNINVIPGKLERLHDISEKGCISSLGKRRQVYQTNHRRFNVYRWSANKILSSDDIHASNFKLYFTTRLKQAYLKHISSIFRLIWKLISQH